MRAQTISGGLVLRTVSVAGTRVRSATGAGATEVWTARSRVGPITRAVTSAPGMLTDVRTRSSLLKNGARILAISAGVWNRRPGSLAIILATSEASSAGTSGRTRCKGLASIERWDWRTSRTFGAWNGGAPERR